MKKIITILALSSFMMLGAHADHAWEDFHWKRSVNPLQLDIIDNTTATWTGLLQDVSNGLNASSVLQITITAGSDARKDRKKCTKVKGKMKVCDANYGRNGWLGEAEILVNQDSHIISASAKLNNTYFDMAVYDNPYAKEHVLCQEIVHGLGLTHTGGKTCMNNSEGLFDPNFTGLNPHDFAQLALIYSHLDEEIVPDDPTDDPTDDPPGNNGKGKGGGKKGKSITFSKLKGGNTLITVKILAD